MREPQADWVSERLSRDHIADYKPFVFVDGEGVRCSLYVSGCLFACDGCFNEAAWSFRYGRPYTTELEDRIIADLGHESVQGLSLLGGEPFLNTGVCLRLIARMRAELGPTKDVWAWSGFTFEQLLAGSPDKVELLRELDVLVDGPFTLAERDLTLPFRGSRNQRVLDVRASLRAGAAVRAQRVA
ncbi:anaerobic ribonucleoside-triphosphate reductase activating protein [Sanguibacter suaedae]|uniref:Anaerobic ribonucleoside-triphosphate reductase-activating protein n=1 Tax=Sanguibacter suaedae TaxID=2795737 RepID=A0A934IBZ4_9MICO|nr:anaerobic ribonucleoside-triphosphate reductase activating protein [Sanguibacter suaedae]MBI9114990.1 anaerobic ribonucleoside-triphosphate reductase activating protein [Sanguibacter suaedae]